MLNFYPCIWEVIKAEWYQMLCLSQAAVNLIPNLGINERMKRYLDSRTNKYSRWLAIFIWKVCNTKLRFPNSAFMPLTIVGFFFLWHWFVGFAIFYLLSSICLFFITLSTFSITHLIRWPFYNVLLAKYGGCHPSELFSCC